MEHARRIVTFDWVSADGYFFAGPDGSLVWGVPDVEQAKAATASIPNFDTALFGRQTYEIFEKFWGQVVVDDADTVPDPHRPERRSPEHGAMAIALNKMSKLVFSKTMKDAVWKNSRLVRELDPARDRDHEAATRQRHDPRPRPSGDSIS